ncbi:hypothetical protein [Marilutibacter chinensis]|uniref:Phospholipid transport system substrate-binding protein n=1 Tax=Marilutibacter chinensis TaxID=2912247 RepID=A0ABS9HR59_9GAMM|nr:hypothetical protein [Lysobacter chinensis]MCF7220582.1 hypothetical protein [Lysobacter chinensis]
MMSTCKHLLSVLILGLVAGLLSAPAAAETPEAFMQRYVEAVREDGVGVTADFVHPEEAERFRAMLAPVFGAMPRTEANALAKMLFGGKADAGTVAAMPADRFMRSFLRFVEKQATTGLPGKGGIRITDFVPLGSVQEGEVHHFVARGTVEAGGLTLTKLEVVSIRPHGNGWGMLLSGEVDGMAEAIKATMASGAGAKGPQDGGR